MGLPASSDTPSDARHVPRREAGRSPTLRLLLTISVAVVAALLTVLAAVTLRASWRKSEAFKQWDLSQRGELSVGDGEIVKRTCEEHTERPVNNRGGGASSYRHYVHYRLSGPHHWWHYRDLVGVYHDRDYHEPCEWASDKRRVAVRVKTWQLGGQRLVRLEGNEPTRPAELSGPKFAVLTGFLAFSAAAVVMLGFVLHY
jgi:hypothetical protein